MTTIQLPTQRPETARKRGRRSVLIPVAGAFIALVVICAIFGRQLAPSDPAAQNLPACRLRIIRTGSAPTVRAATYSRASWSAPGMP
jgi:hypothetical protein